MRLPVPLEPVERRLRAKVLKLQLDLWEHLLDGVDKLVHELLRLGDRPPLLPETEVERVREQLGVVGPEVEADREGRARVDTGSSDVEGELADGDPHPSDSKIAETEDAGAVGYDGDSGSLATGPVLEDRLDRALVGEGDVHALRSAVDLDKKSVRGRGVRRERWGWQE